MKTIKKLVFTAIFVVPFILTAQKTKTVSAGPIAYIEQTKILKSIQGFEKNTKEIDSLKQVYTKQIQDGEKKLQDDILLLFKPYQFSEKETIDVIKTKLKENDLAKFELYLKESELLDKSAKNFDLMINALYTQKVQPSLNKVNSTIETYSKANKIVVVYTLENISAALAYIDKGVNITDEIIKNLK